jgi:hypothetical protein
MEEGNERQNEVWENRKDGVMCKVDIIDYSVSGAF